MEFVVLDHIESNPGSLKLSRAQTTTHVRPILTHLSLRTVYSPYGQDRSNQSHPIRFRPRLLLPTKSLLSQWLTCRGSLYHERSRCTVSIQRFISYCGFLSMSLSRLSFLILPTLPLSYLSPSTAHPAIQQWSANATMIADPLVCLRETVYGEAAVAVLIKSLSKHVFQDS
jgi:hypothetical protein